MSNQRTQDEMDQAARDMEHLCYPPFVKLWDRSSDDPDSGCQECGEVLIHKITCSSPRNTRFTGHASFVKRTRTPDSQCEANGCEADATNRIRLNVWGVLFEYDVCAFHACNSDGRSRDGNMCDGV